MKALFWSAVGMILYSYLGYPLVLALISKMVRAGKGSMVKSDRDSLPRVAVVLSAFNEEAHIRERVENLMDQDYPSGKLEVYVGSDGSTDRTVAILEELRSPVLHVFAFPQRRGKASVLNDLMATVEEPIVVFTDANVHFESDAVQILVASMIEQNAGAVCGQLNLRSSAGDNQDALYWRVERFLKDVEGRIGGLLGANGAIYAIRRDCYESLPPDTIIDDFIIAMKIASRGNLLIYEPAARALEDTPDTIDDEFRRRVRIGLGNYQALFRYPEFLTSVGVIRAFCYVSHKVLRWFGPHLLILMLVSSLILYREGPFAILFWIQILGYAALVFANLMRRWLKLPKILSGMVMLGGLNLAFALAFLRYFRGGTQGHWTRTQRRGAP